MSAIENERKFNSNILNKIPDTVTSLDIRGCFRGSISFNNPDDLATALPNLQSLNISRRGSLRFYPDQDSLSQDGGLVLPLVSETVTSYNATSNDFRRI